LLALCLAQFGLVLAFQGTALAMPVVGDALHLGPGTRQWLVSANALAFGGGLLPAGRAADVYGHRRLFVIGCGTFAIASLGAGMAPSIGWLIACRILQGIGTACSTPATMALLADTFPEGAARRRALAWWGTAGPVGGIAAIVIGGLAIEAIGWRAMFLLGAPVVAPAIPLALKVLPAAHRTGQAPPNPRAAIIGTLGVASLVYALAECAAERPSVTVIMGATLMAAGFLAGFARLERTAAHPIVAPRLGRIRDVAAAVVISFFHGASTNTFIIFYGLAMQELHGWSTFRVGLGFIPCNIGVVSGALVASRLAARRGFRPTAIFGMGMVIVGLLLLMRLDAWLVMTGLGTAGLGLGAANVGMIGMATDAAPEPDRGAVGALVAMAAQIGTAVGIALLTLAASLPEARDGSLRIAYLGGIVLAALGVAAALPRTGRIR
jgi:MFS family permease